VTVKSVHIKNFKSIVDLSLDLGEVNVFIGENGSGKSNILEALAFGSAAAADKLDNEFLVSRGIRVADVRFMRSAFTSNADEPISIDFTNADDAHLELQISADLTTPYPRWESKWNNKFAFPKSEKNTVVGADDERVKFYRELRNETDAILRSLRAGDLQEDPNYELHIDKVVELASTVLSVARHKLAAPFVGFVIFSPENTALRTFEQEGQITPLGTHGEGLLKLLRVLSTEDRAAWETLGEHLRLLDWFSAIELDAETSPLEQSIRLRDRFIADTMPSFDQRSANEGFLYLLFFLALILSTRTPRFFAIENVDTSLNPKACSELMRRLAALSIDCQKQILFTTHNPSLLDGLNLHDDRQRLFVVSRSRDGHTIARRIHAPKPVGNELPIRLSEAFTRGLLGGLPRNF
jgi:predicted ATPase